jgi:transposase
MKRSYSIDLSDAEWECLKPHVPPPNNRGRPKTHTTREILHAIFYILKSGCAWRLLPRDFPPWETLYWWFRRWRMDGTFERLRTGCCARSCGSARVGTRSRAQALPTLSQQRRLGSVLNTEVMTVTRRFGATSATSWWIPRVCSSKLRCTARRCLTRWTSENSVNAGFRISLPGRWVDREEPAHQARP